jgi:hypothetical protein
MPEDELTISYSLKEVLGDINRKLDTTLALQATKADASYVSDIDSRLRKVETHIEQTVKAGTAREHRREWLIPAFIAAVLTVFTILQYFHW